MSVLQLFYRLAVTKGDRWCGEGGGWTGILGLAYAYCGIWNDWPMGTCCITQRTLHNILWWSIWENNLKNNGCLYMYSWITLLYSKNYHNIVNQLHFKKNFKKWKKFCSNPNAFDRYSQILTVIKKSDSLPKFKFKWN